MSQITIQCRLVASESSRHQLWKLMAELNTPLINELLRQVSQHPEFETWRQKGKHPTSIVKELCQPLKTDPRFIGQPGRFYTSAIALVNYIYKSWFALMKRSQYQLEGKIRWLEMLKSDVELVESSGVSLDSLRTKAAEILVQFAPLNTAETQSTNGKKAKKRHLHWFQRFLEDQQIKKNSKNQHSSSLFTLRSGRLAWQEEEGKGDPWNVNRLTLYCSVDTRLWTTEGTNQVREEKAEKIAKIITNTKAKGKLNEEQQAHIKRQNSTLDTINSPFPRPTKPLYKGQSHILVGISLGLEKPATLAVVDGTTGQVITYHSIRQLLGDNYKLVNRQRQQKHFLSHQRQIAQTLAAPNQFGESELGEYIDRLLAKEIIAIAQTYSAGSIVLPKLDNMREQVQSEVQAKAEQKSDLIEVQKQYAKQYRVSVHQWSYGRLMANIQSQAVKAGIVIEESKQPIRGSPQEKAKELAIAAYHSRKIN
ncbi:type V CRISPR-associated protein Cas12k [Nostoc sp.]